MTWFREDDEVQFLVSSFLFENSLENSKSILVHGVNADPIFTTNLPTDDLFIEYSLEREKSKSTESA